MTETVQEPVQEQSPIEKLRSEFQEQFTTLKSSFQTELSNLKTQNDTLAKENEELHRALIRSAVTPVPSQEPKEPTYEDRILALAKKTLQYMS